MNIKETEELIKRVFPKALPGDEVLNHYFTLMQKDHQIDLEKTLFATSICSDDANFSADFSKVLSRPFVMGGLGGLPYTGITGMVAYAHHIPDNGSAFIFYGPHVGFNDKGEIGRMRRPGQSHDTNSCGALMLALDRLGTEDHEEVYVPLSSELDFQQTMLERSLMPFKHEIVNSDNPKLQITIHTYNVIEKMLKKFISISKNEFHCDKIILLGGIIINTDPSLPDYLDARNFEVLDLKDIKSIKTHDFSDFVAFKDL
ncbi:MAG TPA: hypothetical protein VL947_11140 [Cytophagales bacterium]|nr:hypothetical protein [Cytophagales bacterium]